MTLTFALTILAAWIVGSIPVSLMIVSMMRVDPLADDGDDMVAVEHVLRETA
jgi:glycerol-3-phosphate acyltransferase PlsY